jgi:hypothetical protein
MQPFIYWLRILNNMEVYEIDNFMSELDLQVSEHIEKTAMLREAIEAAQSIL